MLLTKGQKLKKYFSAFVVGVVFLFVLSAQNALATSTITTYQKPVNGTLESAEWNGLLTDFVNTWLPATMVGPLGIGTSSQVGKLNVEGAGTYSAIFTNGSVGIGLTNPSQMLHVNGAGQFDQFVYGITPVNVPAYKMALATVEYVNSALATSTQNILDAGFWKLSGDNLFASSTSWRLGIGTTNPVSILNVARTTSGSSATLTVNPSGSGANVYQDLDFEHWNWGASPRTLTKIRSTMRGFGDGELSLWTSLGSVAYERLTINKDGNVGIGTTNPTQKLDVAGSLRLSGSFFASSDGAKSFFVDRYSTNSFSDEFAFRKGRGVESSPVLVSSGDELGGVEFHGYNGSGFTASAMIRGYVDGATSAGNVPGRLSLFVNSGAQAGYGTEALTIKSSGNVGIGTTTPAQLLHVAGQAQFDNLAFGVTPVNSLANKLALATVEYVNGYVSTATSTLASTTIGKFVGATPDTYNGSNNGHPGYAYANNQCATTPSMLGSHVCTTAEILNTILLANNTLPSEDVWIFSGPPGFTAMANDCIARTSVNNDANTFGAIWQGKTVQYPEGRGLLKHCHETAKIACCK